MVMRSGGKVIRDHFYASTMPAAGSTITGKSATAGQAYSYTLQAGELTGDGHISATKGDGSALPAWLTWSDSERKLSASSASVSGTVAVKLTKKLGEYSASQTFNLVVS
jgi:hypothetical protein